LNYIIWVYRLGAISNWLVTFIAIVNPNSSANLFGQLQSRLPETLQMGHNAFPILNNPFLLIIWSGMAFLWAFVMWEFSNDPIKNFRLAKYPWIEKCVTTYAVTWGVFIDGSAPMVVFLFVLYTDVLWIVLFIIAHINLRKIMAG